MRNRKSNTKMNCGRDRLSELPDSLIFDIFQLLPVTDVVRTTILSKRWKNLWTTSPWLDFDDSKMMTDAHKFGNFVDGLLNSWRGNDIFRLNVQFVSKLAKPLPSDIDRLMHFAIEKRVQQLHLELPEQYLVPQYLYSCSSLEKLTLRRCELRIHGNVVHWDRLKKLDIEHKILCENAINQILCGCPILEVLSLILYDSNQNLSVQSTSLKRLYIGKFFNSAKKHLSRDTELRIRTPNLKFFYMFGVPYGKCLLMDVSSLREASLEIDGPEIYGHALFSGTDFVEDTMAQILPTIKHVQEVSLSNWCIKALGTMKDKHVLSPFPMAKFLKLRVCCEEYQHIVGVVEMFPSLRDLVIETTCESLPQHAESSLKFDRYYPYSFLLHLRTVYVTWTNGDHSIFPLIQILLKYARNLEKLVLSRGKSNETRTSWKPLFMASQKLLKMQRSSPTAELIFR